MPIIRKISAELYFGNDTIVVGLATFIHTLIEKTTYSANEIDLYPPTRNLILYDWTYNAYYTQTPLVLCARGIPRFKSKQNILYSRDIIKLGINTYFSTPYRCDYYICYIKMQKLIIFFIYMCRNAALYIQTR